MLLEFVFIVGPCLASPTLGVGEGVIFPTIGPGRGFWDLSVGVHFWNDHVSFRNLQLVCDLDLGKGLRWHGVLRSNGDVKGIERFAPRFDENYLELYFTGARGGNNWSFSAKLGRSMYLRFPYPDAISLFDQVPGIWDLDEGGYSGYSGFILSSEWSHRSGLGAHGTWISWGWGVDRDDSWVERYLFFRRGLGDLYLELRYGFLQRRTKVLGQSSEGFSLFVGFPLGDLQLGLLYENLRKEKTYSGIIVKFPANSRTKWAGKFAFDYTRKPEGFALQIPILSGSFGGLRRISVDDGLVFGSLVRGESLGISSGGIWLLVGEVFAERVKTYWQNGQNRNFYEHRLFSWGNTSSSELLVVAEEGPWQLELEALVSPNVDVWGWEKLKKWERERMGPAQLSQKVVYKFYKRIE